MKVAFYTLGCKVNQYETQILTELFAKSGYEIVAHTEKSDIYVINSCTVTATGDQKTRKILRHFAAKNPDAKLALTGCFPQAFPEAAAALPEADVIAGAGERGALVGLVERCIATGERVISIKAHERDEPFERMSAVGFSEHSRAFVKIEDGCERYCAYCIIPTARGSVRSKSPDDLRAELLALADAGYREVVLVGINLSCYGKELGLRLIDAVELTCSIPGIERVRLGSLEPELLTGADISRMSAQAKMCPQFHLSLQSGCDATLRRMNRHYDIAEYARIADELRKSFNNCAITTDIMVGFPGEDESEFAESLAFAERIKFAKAHVFAYSPRAGTRAADMPDQVSKFDKDARSARMIALTTKTRDAFWASQLGQEFSVLFERETRGMWEGHSENYIPVRVSAGPDELLRGETRRVRLTAALPDYCEGILV